jgi:hypothetical protein
MATAISGVIGTSVWINRAAGGTIQMDSRIKILIS